MKAYASQADIDEALGATSASVKRTLLPKTLAQSALRSLVTNGDDAYDDLQALLDVLLERSIIRPVRQRRRSGRHHARRWLRDAPQRRAVLLDEAFRWALNEVRPQVVITPSGVWESIQNMLRSYEADGFIVPPNVTVHRVASEPSRLVASIDVPVVDAMFPDTATGDDLDRLAEMVQNELDHPRFVDVTVMPFTPPVPCNHVAIPSLPNLPMFSLPTLVIDDDG